MHTHIYTYKENLQRPEVFTDNTQIYTARSLGAIENNDYMSAMG